MQNQDNLNYVLDNLSGDCIDKQILTNSFQEFKQKYDELLIQVFSNSTQHEKLPWLVSETKMEASKVPKNMKKDNILTSPVRDIIPTLIAHIFAVWTLNNSEQYNEDRGIEKDKAYLLMPHAAQVISIFRIFCIGYKKLDNYNNLVQIGTGEGKSVVMAVTASVFALIGLDVNCSCYSEYLSSRDRDAFASVFEALKIDDRIKYGTFNRLCENLLNEQCNVREIVIKMIVENKSSLTSIISKPPDRLKVLLIDEVDVFLSEKYYGGLYLPSVYLNDIYIKNLLDEIWKNKNATPLLLETVKAMPSYTECATKFSNWTFLIDEAIKDMINSLKNYQSSTYVVNNDRICYIEGESIVANLVRGYDTIWAYYHENEKNNITLESLKKNVGIIINCGTFSYAEMPHFFSFISGVSGTLETLTKKEKNILETVYKISKTTIMPSVFGKNNRIYNKSDNVILVNETDYFMTIRNKIDAMCNAKRAILVFFSCTDKLMEFYNSSQLASIRSRVQILTEKVAVSERDLLIKRCATEGKVTLLTKMFGRGTDFICTNQKIIANGGIHILQTFFTEEVSEEYQIMGRGARQGDEGSYSMILLDKDLEWILGPNWAVKLRNITRFNLYDTLNQARDKILESKFGGREIAIKKCKVEHEKSEKFMKSLISGDIEGIKIFLLGYNLGSSLPNCSSRTVLLMDGTGSMSACLTAAKDTVCTMFERTSIILRDQGIPENVFQMQFVIYRNYSSGPEKILQSSSWESDPKPLRAFMATIGPSGGQGNEAIEIGFWHAANEACSEKAISQVILIGDAPANTEEEVQSKREPKNWKKTPYENPTFWMNEINRLKACNVPVHAFYVDNNAESNFRNIAAETGGRCESLDIHSSSGAEFLTNLVTEEILRKAAGTKGEAAVQLYRRKFPSFTS